MYFKKRIRYEYHFLAILSSKNKFSRERLRSSCFTGEMSFLTEIFLRKFQLYEIYHNISYWTSATTATITAGNEMHYFLVCFVQTQSLHRRTHTLSVRISTLHCRSILRKGKRRIYTFTLVHNNTYDNTFT